VRGFAAFYKQDWIPWSASGAVENAIGDVARYDFDSLPMNLKADATNEAAALLIERNVVVGITEDTDIARHLA
jgi:hypothetical protein